MLLRRLAITFALAAIAVGPWLVWPGHEEPFSTPKRVALVAAAAGLWALLLVGRRRTGPVVASGPLDLAALAWIAAFAWSALRAEIASPAALWLGVAGPAWALALVRVAPPLSAALTTMLVSAAGMAALSLAQWMGADPFPALGWAPEIGGGSERLRVYATLGNPNFVAAWLSMHVPLAASAARAANATPARLAAMTTVALLLAAVAATGSRGGALGVAVGLASFALLARASRALWVVAAAGALLAVLVWLSPARVLPQTAAGRWYILLVAGPHAFDEPVAGHGPGAFELRYPAWEQEGRRSGRLPSSLVRRFAGPQPHAHNDYLQAVIERGVAGGVTFLLVLTTILVQGGRRLPEGAPAGARRRSARAALTASALAMAACALVDFPFQRPAETMTFWTCAALLWRPVAGDEDTRR